MAIVQQFDVIKGVARSFTFYDRSVGGDLSAYTVRASLKQNGALIGQVLSIGSGISALSGGKWLITITSGHAGGLIVGVTTYLYVELTSPGGTEIERRAQLRIVKNEVV